MESVSTCPEETSAVYQFATHGAHAQSRYDGTMAGRCCERPVTPEHRADVLSVIMPVFNVADTVSFQLDALSRQTYQGDWELIVADNGSTDGTLSVIDEWAGCFPAFSVVDASRIPGAAAARNQAASRARGRVLVFCDGDDVVQPAWLSGMSAAAQSYDLVAGAIDPFSLNRFNVPLSDASSLRQAPIALSFKPFAISANMAVSRRAFNHVGGFSERLSHMEDVDLSWRVQLAGYPLYFEPSAVVAKRYSQDLLTVWRKSVGQGGGDVVMYRHYRQYGVEFPCGVGPLYSDFKGVFAARHGIGVSLNVHALVAAAGRNYGRFAGWWRLPAWYTSHSPGSMSGR